MMRTLIVNQDRLSKELVQLKNETIASHASSIKSLEVQLGQLALHVGRTDEKGKLPSQPLPNPNANVNAVTLRSDRELEEVLKEPNPKEATPKSKEVDQELEVQPSHTETVHLDKEAPPSLKILPPFPQRLIKSKKAGEEKEILEILRKVAINIPLLDALAHMPRYAKLLKDLCTNKGRLKGNETITVGENVSAILRKKLPTKCEDPGMFTVPCTIGEVEIQKAMCDLGASINVMLLSIYETLKVASQGSWNYHTFGGPGAVVRPVGVLEDILVKVRELIFPADFYIIDMKTHPCPHFSSVLLGRPFLKTANTKIDVHSGSLTMEFDGELIKFNIYDAMRHPYDASSMVLALDSVDSLVQDTFLVKGDDMKVVLENHLNTDYLRQQGSALDTEIEELIFELDSAPLHFPTLAYLDLPKLRTLHFSPLWSELLHCWSSNQLAHPQICVFR
ncbi:hypothetical protein Syun_029189 [Stephania yunnanensis]|uniref:Aspartic peptidase DDI1-type domain-containing protein n=1 Tax=Stephania yunnanensis TaxID=152371 RepID=A0AAP0E7H6_9MAGN